jgi:radical SAM superfamily enzyme YgiQ (UPF0313 family)
MADVILFRPKMSKGMGEPLLGSSPPLGLLFIAAPLIQNNYKVKIIDEETNFYWLEDLNEELDDSTICVGISSMTGRQISKGLKFAEIVKDRFDIPVVWGGLHPSMLPEQTAKNNLVDIVVRGEGEEACLKIVIALKHRNSLKNIPNVWWKENGKIYSNPKDQFIDLNSTPLLPYHLLDCEKYIRIKRDYLSNCKRSFDLQTDRGCPHRCGFCYNININKCKWRAFTAPKVIEQIEYLISKFSLDGINFVSDNFFVDKKRVTEICTEIIKRKIKIDWHADCRIDYFLRYDNSFIELLNKSGCKALTFGVESGSQRILNLIHKDISLDEVFKVNEKLRKLQIGVNYHFMAGFPGETKEDLLQTYKIMFRLHDEYPRVNFFGPAIYTPYPGTSLYDKCLEMGFKPPETLRDWGKFGWDEKTCLPFIKPNYSKWLTKSTNIVRRISVSGKGLGWIRWWFRLRAKIIVKFKIIGPQPEERLIYSAKTIVNFVRKLLKAK